MSFTRRDLLRTAAIGGAATLAAPLAAPAIVHATGSLDPIRVGYLHTLAVDGQIWTAAHHGFWEKQGLKPTFTRFYTGLEIFQAMVGNSIDVLSTGAVISNFPSRGQGKAFLINSVEFATAQLWVNPEMGIASFADLKGKKIATSIGTTAHVFLDRALRANGLDPKTDVQIINQRMPDATTAFISGAVPAVALWVPFNLQIRQRVPGAKMLVDASAFYPDAAILGGWAARNDFYEQRKDVLERIIKAWLPANRELIENPEATLKMLQETQYTDVPLAELKEQFAAQKLFPAEKWAEMYRDGTVTDWLNRVTDFYAKIGGASDVIPATKYFDPALFLKAVG